MSRARLIVVLTAVAAVVSMGLAGSALASYSVVRDSGWVQFNTAGLPDSDCWMQNQLVQDPLSGYAYGRGRTYCYNNHTSIQVVERLARTDPDGTTSRWVSPVTSVYSQSSAWIYTTAHYDGCSRFQSIVQAWVTNGSSQLYNYKTSGVPVKFSDHCPY